MVWEICDAIVLSATLPIAAIIAFSLTAIEPARAQTIQDVSTEAVQEDKPDSGYGVGVDLRADTPLGLVRLEIGFSDRGGSLITITTGDRF